VNTGNISELKLRIDKLEKEKELNNQRFRSIEDEINSEKMIASPPKSKTTH